MDRRRLEYGSSTPSTIVGISPSRRRRGEVADRRHRVVLRGGGSRKLRRSVFRADGRPATTVAGPAPAGHGCRTPGMNVPDHAEAVDDVIGECDVGVVIGAVCRFMDLVSGETYGHGAVLHHHIGGTVELEAAHVDGRPTAKCSSEKVIGPASGFPLVLSPSGHHRLRCGPWRSSRT